MSVVVLNVSAMLCSWLCLEQVHSVYHFVFVRKILGALRQDCTLLEYMSHTFQLAFTSPRMYCVYFCKPIGFICIIYILLSTSDPSSQSRNIQDDWLSVDSSPSPH